MKVMQSHVPAMFALVLLLLSCPPASAWAQAPSTVEEQPASPAAAPAKQDQQQKEEPGIQDNSFLVEEAYNQEYGVVQHIQTFQRFWKSRSWGYSYTNEWPVDAAPRHQLSYTIPVMDLATGNGSGIGDIALNYRYQLIGSGETRVAFSPRFTVLVPTGDYRTGQGAGAPGYQGMLPVSWVHNERFVTHWNLGATITPSQKDPLGETANTYAVTAGQSVIYNVTRRVNVFLETVWVSTENVVAAGKTERANAVFLNPAVRWAYNFKNGTQIVPGLGIPVGVGPSQGEWGIFAYFSVEHPFTRARNK